VDRSTTVGAIFGGCVKHPFPSASLSAVERTAERRAHSIRRADKRGAHALDLAISERSIDRRQIGLRVSSERFGYADLPGRAHGRSFTEGDRRQSDDRGRRSGLAPELAVLREGLAKTLPGRLQIAFVASDHPGVAENGAEGFGVLFASGERKRLLVENEKGAPWAPPSSLVSKRGLHRAQRVKCTASPASPSALRIWIVTVWPGAITESTLRSLRIEREALMTRRRVG
jgi:hypothetical protein